MSSFTKPQQALLACLGRSVSGTESEFDFSTLTENDWLEVLAESRAQSVDILCYDATAGISLPPRISIEWLTLAAKLLPINVKVQSVQNKLVKLLEENGVPYVILKGLASSSYYPAPENRISGDIDFLVPEEHIELCEELLSQSGACHTEDINENHISFRWNDVELELHRAVAGIPKNEQGREFTSYFASVFERSVTDENYGFKKPCDSMHGVVILLHTVHHIISKGIGLRHICDWACFVSATKDKPFWREELLPLFKKTGLLKFVFILTELSVKYFRIIPPDWHEGAAEETVDMLLSEVLRAGNFGKKAHNESGTDIMVTNGYNENSFWGRIRAMLVKLKTTNPSVYPIVKKRPWLSPFFSGWRILKYGVLVICGKRASLRKTAQFAESRSALAEAFELYAIDKD